MTHPILDQLQRLGRRAVQLLWCRALCRLLAVALALLLALGGLDYALRLRDPGLRWLLSIGFWGTLAWAFWRWVRPLGRLRADPLTVARYVEEQIPQLNDQLASTVAFLQQAEDDPRAGSAQLRRVVIHEMESQFPSLDLRRVLQLRRLAAPLAVALGLLVVAAVLAFWQPRLARLAVVRLAAPWAEAPWPQRYHLRLVDPQTQVARGQPWQVVVEAADGGSLPSQVWLHLRYPSGEEERVPMRQVENRMVYHKPRVQQPLEFRATGGDDESMPWHRLRVVDPPQVTGVVFTIRPPKYTGWKPSETPRPSRVLSGSRLLVRGESNVPLRQAFLVLQDKTRREVPLQLDDSARRFRLAPDQEANAVLEKNVAVTLRLVDRQGVETLHRPSWHVRVVPDNPPRITLQEPQGALLLTPQAVVPLAAQVQDDLGVHQVALRYLASENSDQGHQDQVLYRGPEPPKPAGPSLEQRSSPPPVNVRHQWALAPLRLAPGTQLSWQLVARDYRPQQAATPPLRITIITPEQLHDHLAQQQQKILQHLSRVLQTQRQAREQVREAQVHLEQAQQLRARELDHLKSAEVNQRQVDRMLAGKSGSLRQMIARYRWMVKINRLDHPEALRRMDALDQMIDQLRQRHLGPIGRELASAVKELQSALEQRADSADPVVSAQEAPAQQIQLAAQEQEKVIQALERQLSQLTDWDNYRRFFRELNKLRRRFQALNEETRKTARQTLGKSAQQLSGRQRAQLARMAQQQQQLARQLDTLRARMEQMAGHLAAKQPQSAQVLQDAVDLARSRQLSSRMRSAARHTQANRMGQALNQQQQVLEQLEQLIDVLANRRQQQLARQLQNLRQTQQELRQLHQQQLRLAKRLKQLSGQKSDPQAKQQLQRLRRLQRQLAEQTKRLARQLQRLQAQRAGQTAQQAAGSMEQAAQAAAEGQTEQAAAKAQEAEQKLADLQRELGQQAARLQRRLAEEQLAQLTDLLQALHQRQQELLQRTRRIQQKRLGPGELDPTQWLTLNQLAEDQQLLARELEQQTARLQAAKVFHQALQGAVDQMETAAVLLARRRTDAATTEAQQQALTRLAQVLQALKPQQPDGPQGQQAPSGGGAGQPGRSGGRGPVAVLAQLRLLKLWQESLNARTEELHRRLARQNRWTPELQRQLQLLQQEQGRLAQLLLDLAATDDEAPEEKLPEELQLPLEELESPSPSPSPMEPARP